MEMVVKNFIDSGMTEVQIAERMHVPLTYVQGYLN